MNRRAFSAVSMLAVACVVAIPLPSQATDECRVFAEISIELASQGALLVCLNSGNPVACAIASVSQSVATKGVAKAGVEAGCRWLVDKDGDHLFITISGPKEKEKTVLEAGGVLKKVPGVNVE